ncbi:hypothetical protein ZWY2020_003141 [Hordeum vulgare]|nr:hypothetical protein ZWY2020_003141 [Hordeum vulgare]
MVGWCCTCWTREGNRELREREETKERREVTGRGWPVRLRWGKRPGVAVLLHACAATNENMAEAQGNGSPAMRGRGGSQIRDGACRIHLFPTVGESLHATTASSFGGHGGPAGGRGERSYGRTRTGEGEGGVGLGVDLVAPARRAGELWLAWGSSAVVKAGRGQALGRAPRRCGYAYAPLQALDASGGSAREELLGRAESGDLVIIYMDFVEVPRLLAYEHRIDYSLPRSWFVCNDDFKLIEEIHRNKLSLDKIDFGKRNLRHLAEMSYVRLEACNGTRRQNNKFVGTDAHIPDIRSNPAMDGCEVGGNVCGSLDDWLHPLPSSEELEIPSHMIPIYDKHKELDATKVKKVLKSFGQVLEAMFCMRVASILVEANATATSSNDHLPEDVTFHAPNGNAADVDHTWAPIHTSREVHKSPTAQELDVDREVEGCTNTDQNEAQRDIGLEKMQSCGFQGMEDVQQEPNIGEHEKSAGTKVVVRDLKDPCVVDEGQSLILSQPHTARWLHCKDLPWN